MTDRAFGLSDAPVAVLVRRDGKVVVAGNSKVGTDNDVAPPAAQRRRHPRRRRSASAASRCSTPGTYPVVGDAVAPRRRARARRRAACGSAGGRGSRCCATRATPRPRPDPRRASWSTAPARCTASPPGARRSRRPPAGTPKWPGKDVGARRRGPHRRSRARGRGDRRALHPFRFGDGSVTDLAGHGQHDVAGQGHGPRRRGRPRGHRRLRGEPDRAACTRSGSATGTRPPIPTGVTTWPGQDFARGHRAAPERRGRLRARRQRRAAPVRRRARRRTPARPSWPGQDRARGVAIAPDGSGGWVLDSLGDLYPFGIGDQPEARGHGAAARPGPAPDRPRRRGASLTGARSAR